MKRPWIRLYTDVPNNPKVQRLSGELFKFWINCLCLAAEDGSLPTDLDIAFVTRLKPSQVRASIEKLVSAGLIDANNSVSGAFDIHAWDEHQFASDMSNERVKKHRERRRNVTTTVTETPPEQSRTDHIQSRTDQREEPRAKDALGGLTPIPPKVSKDPDFQQLIGAFLSLGIELSERDMQICAREWISLSVVLQGMAVADARTRSTGEWAHREGKYVPRPWNYLRERQWERKAVANARERPASRSEISHDAAAEAFMREKGVQ